MPILGALFRSADYQQDKTELVFVATVHLVKPLLKPTSRCRPTRSRPRRAPSCCWAAASKARRTPRPRPLPAAAAPAAVPADAPAEKAAQATTQEAARGFELK
ncbi:hypothetical protein LP420_18745 [Massilia sp. B-10]|nr:hypothetical protein LP420_18745 [Massilia sp. B-10]